jgi:hypothetical protein
MMRSPLELPQAAIFLAASKAAQDQEMAACGNSWRG